jgi:PAS domain S-box-containing protein
MKAAVKKLSKFPSLRIVITYAIVSAIYIYTSDHLLRLFTSDVGILSQLQTYKGLGFIVITSALLYILVKNNIKTTSSYYQRILDIKELSDTELMRSREEYMLLFNNSPLPTWLFDLETLCFIMVNDAACELYGYSREEFLSMTIRDIRPIDDIPSMETAVSSSIHNEKYTFDNIFRHQKKNGEIIQVKIKIAYVNFENRKVRLASVTDISAEMQIQAKLIETNSRLRMASEIAGLGYWTNDLIEQKIQWTDEVYSIFELDPSTFQLSLDNIRERFHPEDRQEFDLELGTIFETNAIRESERRIISGSGKIKWVLERIYLTKDNNGIPVRIEGIVLDITKRKLNEQSIRESNERFKLLTKATVEAIIDWDIQNNEVIWGEGFHTMLGYDLKENNFRLWSDNIHPDDRKKVLYDLNKTMSDPTKQFFNAEFRFLKANGDVAYVQHRGIFIRDEHGRATRALGAMIDLTEGLTRLRKIELQDKALKEIAWTQSHVVRAPLANLMGLISLMKNNANTGVTDDVLLGYISDTAEKLDTVIREIVSKTLIEEAQQANVSNTLISDLE